MNRTDQAGMRGERIALADKAAFSIGSARINPPLREIAATATATVEPRVMQVLVALYDADGAVLSRDRLIELCWGGVVVGDDAINRAIAELRRATARAGADFEIETIPRIGYRLKRGAEAEASTGTQGDEASPGPALSRRGWVVGATAAGAVGLAGLIWSRTDRKDGATSDLLANARRALRSELPNDTREAIRLLEQATRRSPGDAEAAGLLAIAWRNAAEAAPSDQVSQAVQRADQAARRALSLDPAEGNALTALATLQPYMGDWIKSERKLLEILEVAPDTLPAINHLTTLYQSAGLLRRSKTLNDRALALDPLSPVFQFRDALKHWIFGQDAAADLTIDRVLQVWPRHPAVWNARLMLYAFTGRADAALAMLDNPAVGPQPAPIPLVSLWRVSLAAIGNPTGPAIDAAVAANLAAVGKSESQAVVSMMILSTLGRIDDAYAVARGYFLGQGPTVAAPFRERQVIIADQLWKRSMMLFTPATLAMRQDARFSGLCEAMGLAGFWNQPEHAPDYREFDKHR